MKPRKRITSIGNIGLSTNYERAEPPPRVTSIGNVGLSEELKGPKAETVEERPVGAGVSRNDP